VLILVTGSRSWTDEDLVGTSLLAVRDRLAALEREPRPVALMEGEGGKADIAARRFAIEQGWKVIRRPAQWKKFGYGAGPLRNREMIADAVRLRDQHQAAVAIVGFVAWCLEEGCRYRHAYGERHPTHGTAHCLDLARRAGLDVTTVEATTSTI
jgi:YspA, cpYpsA-related SLOG family